jgi:hypothetical protein
VSVVFRMAADVIESGGIAVVIRKEPLRADPPERVYGHRSPPGAGLQRVEGFDCSAQAILHGAYITVPTTPEARQEVLRVAVHI